MWVRHRVFVQEQGVAPEIEWDEIDRDAIHLAAISGGRVVGAARVFSDGAEWHVGRVAVLQQYRGRGVGTLLMRVAEGIAQERGALEVALNAQAPVVEFYLRLGYSGEGSIFFEAGIPHRRMIKRLTELLTEKALSLELTL